ncbi:oligosaccharide flippase family protein [Tabrizicola oligotrophica]|uniref:Oligosaccharide flippase family protein n=1 Tax=Tabrizicola oligotrophica TaxID=2710650 RepID=A0A6M0QQD9_9RHOB|nr:oligosaccharide flippase family protein [Tabrizicola oligotrophica]NEY89695.1 oligosaccharide flippase family protein [Tabrizicola oligotrophica]
MSSAFVPPARSLFQRALTGSVLTAGSYAVMQALRLVSNLILTRLLFPEAFGLMALVSVVLVGLSMFSDMGIGPAISRHPRGDEPEFLDTAFSFDVARGVALWLFTCALAWPMARFYEAPDLARLLPAAGLTLFIAGFNPTRIDTANRHLLLGRVTLLDLLAQVTGIVSMIALAFLLQSVWALVIGAIIGALAKLVVMHLWLPGRPNRFRWDREAGRDLIHFGKWIFLSTACGFLLSQGDKAIFGAYLSKADLGIYNIGWFLASFPVLLAGAVTGRVLIPLYREHHPSEGADNARRMRRLRSAVSGGTLLLLAVLGVVGVPLVGLLYDPRYQAAGGVVVIMAMVQMPAVIGMTYDQSALAAGDSRNYFLLMAVRAAVQTGAFLIGMEIAGLWGALAAQGVALTALHPAIARLAHKHKAWDLRHDLTFFALAALLIALILWVNRATAGF